MTKKDSIEPPINPDETPIPLEGEDSAEQAEWDSETVRLSLTDRRTISQQRAYWLADGYFGYDPETVEPYATSLTPVQVTFQHSRSANPTRFVISRPRISGAVKEQFEEHFSRTILNEPSTWKFRWVKESVIITRANA